MWRGALACLRASTPLSMKRERLVDAKIITHRASDDEVKKQWKLVYFRERMRAITGLPNSNAIVSNQPVRCGEQSLRAIR